MSLIHVREKKPIALIHVREKKPIALIHVREKKLIALIHVREKDIYRLIVKSKRRGKFAETACQSREGREASHSSLDRDLVAGQAHYTVRVWGEGIELQLNYVTNTRHFDFRFVKNKMAGRKPFQTPIVR